MIVAVVPYQPARKVIDRIQQGDRELFKFPRRMLNMSGRCPPCNHSDQAESIPHLALDSKTESGDITNLRREGPGVNLLGLFSSYPRHIRVSY
jgi:hypothetical protein